MPMMPDEMDPRLLEMLQDPLVLAALQRMMAGQAALPGLPPPAEEPPEDSPEGIARGGASKPGLAQAAAQRAGGPPRRPPSFPRR